MVVKADGTFPVTGEALGREFQLQCTIFPRRDDTLIIKFNPLCIEL